LVQRALILALLLLAGTAHAEDVSALQAARFPQPVRVGLLPGRDVLQPIEPQPILGHVAAIVRQDGKLLFVINRGGFLGFGATPVAVPVSDVALLGQYVALMGVTPKEFARLPRFNPSGAAPVPPDTTIEVGIVRPFH
jgi:hypothetical protein